MAAIGSHAQEPARYSGRYLLEVLESFRDDGLSIVYSTDLVKPEMQVTIEPAPADPEELLREILASHGLELRRRGNDLLVVQGAKTTDFPRALPASEPPVLARPSLENVVVHASRYAVHERSPSALNALDGDDIDQLVAAGREPLRVIGRLPGAAASGLSSKQNIRGGEEDEVLVVFDGVPLFEPFHLKDFQNIFSTLDPRVVGDMEVYTGSFPAQYGDRLSAVIDVVPQSAPARPHHEIGLDFFNVGAMSAGSYSDGRGEWLVSARRGNLDLLFDAFNNDIGSPSYFDLFVQTRRQIGNSLSLSGNVMLADDAITVNELDRETQAAADYRTLHAWSVLNHDLSDSLSYRTVLAWVEADNFRTGTVERPGESSGDVMDHRRYQALHLKQDWSFAPSEEFLARWGVDLRRVEARYQYRSDLAFFDDDQIAALTGRSGRNLDILTAPDGAQVGVYLTNRWRFSPKWTAEIGLRWDKQSYVASTENEQTSPRLSLMYTVADNTVLRAGWGRFSQAQGVHELQIEDGVTEFFPAQRSAHTVFGLDHKFSNDLKLRFEVYHKHMDRLRPRFENLFNQLELLPELGSDRTALAPDEATARGAELLLQMDRADSALGWWAGASVSSVEDSFGDRDVPRSWDQKRALNVGLNWNRGLWRADAVAHYHAGWPTTDVLVVGSGSDAAAVLGPRNAANLPDFFSIDLRISRRKPLQENKAWTMFFELTNATARDNRCCVDYSVEANPDGSIFVIQEFDNWLPIIPSLGVIWEF